MSSGGWGKYLEAGRSFLKIGRQAIWRWLTDPISGTIAAIVIVLALAGLQNHYGNPGSEQDAAGIESQQAQILAEGCDAECKAERSEQRAEDDLNAQQDMAWYAALLFFVSALGVGLLGMTLYETRQAGRAAGDILIQARRQADIAEDTARRELRAYLSADPNYIYRFHAERLVEIRFIVANHGQTPAVHVHNVAVIRMAPYPLPDDYPFPEIPINTNSRGVIHPRQESWSNIFMDRLLTPNEVDQVVIGRDVRLYIFGLINYWDIYGNERMTSFCRSVTGPGMRDVVAGVETTDIRFEIGPRYNEAT